MIVDSSALPEQVVADALASAFDSAGQRCSALRVLCLQEDVADRALARCCTGAMAELSVGNPDRLVDRCRPGDHRRSARRHRWRISRRCARAGHRGASAAAAAGVPRTAASSPPTLIEIDSVAELEREVFGPVLHVLRYRRDTLDALVDAINATGYGLTFGVHSRIDETIAHAHRRAPPPATSTSTAT